MTRTADKLGEKLDGGWSTALWYQGYLKLETLTLLQYWMMQSEKQVNNKYRIYYLFFFFFVKL